MGHSVHRGWVGTSGPMSFLGVGMSREVVMSRVCPPGKGSTGYSRQAGGTHSTAMDSYYVFVSSRGVGML